MVTKISLTVTEFRNNLHRVLKMAKVRDEIEVTVPGSEGAYKLRYIGVAGSKKTSLVK